MSFLIPILIPLMIPITTAVRGPPARRQGLCPEGGFETSSGRLKS